MQQPLGRRALGRTGIETSLMGLGSGGPSRLGQRAGTTVESVRRLVRSALDDGIDLIDTAPRYGSSEELLGEALEGVDKSALVLSTKFSPYDADKNLRPPDDLRRSLEQSLSRLRTDHVDIFYLHAVQPSSLDRVWEVFGEPMRDAVDAGLVRFAGVTEAYVDDHDHEAIRRTLQNHDVDVVMVGYNLLSPSARESVFPLAARLGTGVVVMCAVRGVIADPDRLVAVVRNWKQQGLLAAHDVPDEGPLDWLLEEADSIVSAAYKFAAEPAEVSCVLTGTASPVHLAENVEAISGLPLSRATIERVWNLFGKVGRNVSPADATG